MPKIKTVRFGELAYLDEDVVHLPEGLVGMPDLRNWLVLEMGDDLPLKWFQSLDREDFGFPVGQADFFTDTYDISLPAASETILKGQQGEWLVVLGSMGSHAVADECLVEPRLTVSICRHANRFAFVHVLSPTRIFSPLPVRPVGRGCGAGSDPRRGGIARTNDL